MTQFKELSGDKLEQQQADQVEGREIKLQANNNNSDQFQPLELAPLSPPEPKKRHTSESNNNNDFEAEEAPSRAPPLGPNGRQLAEDTGPQAEQMLVGPFRASKVSPINAELTNNNNKSLLGEELLEQVEIGQQLQVGASDDASVGTEFDYGEALAARRQLELAEVGRDADEVEQLLYLRTYSSPTNSSSSSGSSTNCSSALSTPLDMQSNECPMNGFINCDHDNGTTRGQLTSDQLHNMNQQHELHFGAEQQQLFAGAPSQTIGQQQDGRYKSSGHAKGTDEQLLGQQVACTPGGHHQHHEGRQRPAAEAGENIYSSTSELEEDEEGSISQLQLASEANLRQLKASAQEDVQVCGQSKSSTEAARRLFSSLVLSCHQPNEAAEQSGASQWPSEQSGGQRTSTGPVDIYNDSSSKSSNRETETSTITHDFDSGSIRLASSSPSSSSGATAAGTINFRRTLVCSVSPTPDESVLIDTRQQQLVDLAGRCLAPDEDEELRQCRAAFRANRRLIERAQARANSKQRQHLELIGKFGQLPTQVGASSTWNLATLRRATQSAAATQSSPSISEDLVQQQQQQQQQQFEQPDAATRQQWSRTLGSRSMVAVANCSHCQQRLYPMDRMELDFTRAKLNIHRHCFKCQVCSSLLRLETYAAMDSKLYCPAHIKTILPSHR